MRLASIFSSIFIGSTFGQLTIMPTLSAADHEVRLAVVPVEVNGIPIRCASQQVENAVFGEEDSVADLIHKASYGAWKLSGQVLAPVSITMSNDCRSRNELKERVLAELDRRGDNMNAFTNIMFQHSILECGDRFQRSSGYGEFRGRHTYVGRCVDAPLFVHELGHNFGLFHANGYYDQSCPMGLPYELIHFNGAHTAELGFTDPYVVSESGVYRVAATGLPEADEHRLLKLGAFHFVSFRAPIGYDTNLKTDYLNRVHVHWGQPNQETRFKASLIEGEQTDASGYMVKVLRIAAEYSDVEIRIP